MKRKVPESQLAGLKAYGEKSRAENTAKANDAIDRLFTSAKRKLILSPWRLKAE